MGDEFHRATQAVIVGPDRAEARRGAGGGKALRGGRAALTEDPAAEGNMSVKSDTPLEEAEAPAAEGEAAAEGDPMSFEYIPLSPGDPIEAYIAARRSDDPAAAKYVAYVPGESDNPITYLPPGPFSVSSGTSPNPIHSYPGLYWVLF
jgi:hypothetical protein